MKSKIIFLFLLVTHIGFINGMGEIRSCCFNTIGPDGCKAMACQGKRISKMSMWQKRFAFMHFCHPRFMLAAECSAMALVIGLPPFSLGWYFSKRQADKKHKKLLTELNDSFKSESPEYCKQLLEKHIKN